VDKTSILHNRIPFFFIFDMKFLSKSTYEKNFEFTTSFKRIFLVFVAILPFLLINPITPESFAEENNDELKWNTIFITDSPACSNYDYQMLNKYSEITSEYLKVYNITNSAYISECFSYEKFLNQYRGPSDLDLVIIIFERDLGENILHNQKMGGMYSHKGIDRTENNVILICDCPNFYYSEPVWILSHELSHFILHYLGYDSTIVEDLVHAKDKKFDECRESYDKSCESVMMKLRLDSMAYSFTVMPIYEDAKNQKIETSLPDSLMEIVKLNTRFWSEGKITDDDLAYFLETVSTVLPDSTNNRTDVKYTDEPLDPDRITWEEINSVEVDFLQNTFLLQILQSFSDEEKYDSIDSTLGFPTWFYETANDWVDGKIKDKEFLKELEFLRNAGALNP
jgi:hypothetical protein